jgi:hypothetical protein
MSDTLSHDDDILEGPSPYKVSRSSHGTFQFPQEPVPAGQLLFAVGVSPASLPDIEPPPPDQQRFGGVPESFIRFYAKTAARHGAAREVDPGVWVSTIAGLDGAWGEGDSREEALGSLEDAVFNWAIVKLRLRATNIPQIEGLGLQPL